MKIPASVYDKYTEAMSLFSSTDNFGIQCTIIYQKIVPLGSSPGEIRQQLTMQPRMGQTGMLRGGEATKTVEVSENIILRVYSDKKSFERIGSFEYSAGACLTIGNLDQMEDLRKAESLIINSDRNNEVRLQRSGDVILWGLDSQYCVARWSK